MKAFRLHRRLDTDKQRQIRETYPEQADVMIANLQRAVPAIFLSQPDGFDDGIWK